MFPDNTPFFTVSLELFEMFLGFFSKFFILLGRPLSDVVQPFLALPSVYSNVLGRIIEFILEKLVIDGRPLGDYTLFVVLFGGVAAFIVGFSVVKWFVGIITGS